MKKIISILSVMLLVLPPAFAGKFNGSYTYSSPSEGELEDEVEQHEFKFDGSTNVLPADEGSIGVNEFGS